jgi:shikimate kinase
MDQNSKIATSSAPAETPLTLDRSVVLVGLMGSGKSSIGRRLASYLGLGFVDADLEIEAAAGCSIDDIFKNYGETAFRDCEQKVMLRLMAAPAQIIATGGGAFMAPDTRAAIDKHGRSIWLRAELDILLRRCLRRDNRPLLQSGEPREVLRRLMAERYPVYAGADIVVDSDDGPHERVVMAIVQMLRDWPAQRKDEGKSLAAAVEETDAGGKGAAK